MWTIGIENGLAHPLGQSLEEREAWTRHYIKDGHPHLGSALEYIKVHLHNEFIEILFAGDPRRSGNALFFVSMIVYALRNRNALLLTSMLLCFCMD